MLLAVTYRSLLSECRLLLIPAAGVTGQYESFKNLLSHILCLHQSERLIKR